MAHGLANPAGQNHCYLNSLVQSLNAMPSFRATAIAQRCSNCTGSDCILCPLQVRQHSTRTTTAHPATTPLAQSAPSPAPAVR